MAVVLSAAGLLTWAMVVFLAARTLLRPQRMSDARALTILRRLSPTDLDLPYESIDFRVRDEGTGESLRLAAWWIAHPHAGGRCAVLIHGYGDAKVGAIAWAPTFRDLGFNILALDLRAHGDSAGIHSTAGYFERHDINQVIDQLRAMRPQQTRHMVLFGVSLGAAVALAAAVARDDLAGVIVESAYDDFRTTVDRHARLLGMPGPLVGAAAIRLAEWISGADFNAVRPADLVSQIRCPLLVIQPALDPFVPDEDKTELAAAVQRCATARCWRVDQASHATALCIDPDLYRRQIGEFLHKAIESADHPART